MKTPVPEQKKGNIEIASFQFLTDALTDDNRKSYYEAQGDLRKHGTINNFSTFHLIRSNYVT